MVDVSQASIASLRAALQSGRISAVTLVAAHLARIAAYDRPDTPTALNAVVVSNPQALAEARASDARRARGQTLGPLDGIPYTAKDSYLVKGMTAASGSPAFKDLLAQRDAFTVERLRRAGAICLGKTNMPPMAKGGMQRGVYGRAESPYNPDWLAAPFISGSSNGAGVATAASFAAFGLAEETWSSGRGPASHNGLCAYTPSRGVISVRGNWPLVPTMDVVVPYARSMADLLEVLEVIVADDPDSRGDLWRLQPWVKIPTASAVRPDAYPALLAGVESGFAIRGKRFGVPRMYINADPDAGTSDKPSLGSATGQRIETRASVIALWQAARAALEAAGATIVETDFPLVTNYEGDRPGAPTLLERGLVSADFLQDEQWALSAWAFDDFLRANNDPALHRLADVDGAQIFPGYRTSLSLYQNVTSTGMEEYVRIARQGIRPWHEIDTLASGLRALETTRQLDLEDWMTQLGLDAVIFPAVADIAPADADVNPQSNLLARRNGVWVANGNLTIRHLGVPTVTVPMGLLADIAMPVGLTFAGRAYDDNNLLRYAAAFEATGVHRVAPPRTPPLQ